MYFCEIYFKTKGQSSPFTPSGITRGANEAEISHQGSRGASLRRRSYSLPKCVSSDDFLRVLILNLLQLFKCFVNSKDVIFI